MTMTDYESGDLTMDLYNLENREGTYVFKIEPLIDVDASFIRFIRNIFSEGHRREGKPLPAQTMKQRNE